MEREKSFIKIDDSDNVAVALHEIKKGERVCVGGGEYTAKNDIAFGHKMALSDIEKGVQVIKYGYPIGVASCDVKAGELVHSHNLHTGLSGKLKYKYEPQLHEFARPHCRDKFMGYVRENGNVGIRNEIWIVPTVGCVNQTARQLALKAEKLCEGRCDGVFAFPHTSGCSQLGDDMETAQRILGGIINNPNAGAVLVVSLGCENNNLDAFMPFLGKVNTDRVKFMVCQQTEDEIGEGLRLIDELADYTARQKRCSVGADKLTVGFKCGGSDAFSGINANPLCGKISERLAALGASAILTEVPEMFGAETILMNRADSVQTFEKITELINGFKQYYIDYNQPIYENPAPGNKAGGITTLEEKSLGCIQKGGRATVTDTLGFGEKCHKKGLNLLTGPGNDSVSITNLVASGAVMILFTTGRGNPLGTAVPTLKISSNSELYRRKGNWIDYNAGVLAEGETFSEAAEELWNLMLDIASGEKFTKNELVGNKEIAVFKNGVTL